ncbi:MAG: ornithine carbamoyltransferase [Parvibaculales bacterium]
MPNFIDIDALHTDNLVAILRDAKARKEKRKGAPAALPDRDAPLKGFALGMMFDKPSTRTRISFDIAMRQLGGSAILLDGAKMQTDRGESLADTGRVLSAYLDVIMWRTHAHESLLSLAGAASVPVINGLTDYSHPCQIMADLLTLEEKWGSLKGKKIAWVGDGNNVALSWVQAAVLLGVELCVATPKEYALPDVLMKWAGEQGGAVSLGSPKEAATGADCVITDTWFSMGASSAEEKAEIFMPFQVNTALMKLAADDACFLHCLPAHRGEEVSAEVLDADASLVFEAAENRLHAQKAILNWCLSGEGS